MEENDAVRVFWAEAAAARGLSRLRQPAAWAFGATTEHADELLALVLSGKKTATASSGWDYDFSGEPLPVPGELSIILDGNGRPGALIETVTVRATPFNEVDADHAAAEGEGDRTLGYWQDAHARYWREHSENPRGFSPKMPVICERFRLLYPR